MFGLIVILLLLFPNGRLPSSRWRWFAWFSVALTLLAAILAVISPDVGLDFLRSSGSGHISFANSLGVEGLPNLFRLVQTLVLALGPVAAASVVVGRRKARGSSASTSSGYSMLGRHSLSAISSRTPSSPPWEECRGVCGLAIYLRRLVAWAVLSPLA